MKHLIWKWKIFWRFMLQQFNILKFHSDSWWSRRFRLNQHPPLTQQHPGAPRVNEFAKCSKNDMHIYAVKNFLKETFIASLLFQPIACFIVNFYLKHKNSNGKWWLCGLREDYFWDRHNYHNIQYTLIATYSASVDPQYISMYLLLRLKLSLIKKTIKRYLQSYTNYRHCAINKRIVS